MYRLLRQKQEQRLELDFVDAGEHDRAASLILFLQLNHHVEQFCIRHAFDQYFENCAQIFQIFLERIPKLIQMVFFKIIKISRND